MDLTRIAVLYIDLDGFKAIDDTFGHQAGVEILVGFAERLHHLIRPTDVLARLGGDDFTVLPVDADDAQLFAIGDQVVQREAVPFVCDGHLLYVSASVGVRRRPSASVGVRRRPSASRWPMRSRRKRS